MYSEDKYALDEDFDDGNNQNVFDFITLTSYIALITGNMLQPVYILKIFEKGKAITKMHDKSGHMILPDELYLKGNYLIKTRCKNINKIKFRIVDNTVLVTPDEIFDYFIDVKEDLTMEANIYIELSERVTV